MRGLVSMQTTLLYVESTYKATSVGLAEAWAARGIHKSESAAQMCLLRAAKEGLVVKIKLPVHGGMIGSTPAEYALTHEGYRYLSRLRESVKPWPKQ